MAKEYTTWTDVAGKVYKKIYDDGELIEFAAMPLHLQPSSKTRLEGPLLAAAAEWNLWELIAAEAKKRGELAAYINGLDARVEVAWDALMGHIPAWVVIDIGD